ncbi:MAG: hypothetical protein CR997_08990 [Acidobacteria bacterium]|nr:MAG: hypothetical protein CR997_08990 [Acidobacteriota bacterium]
MTKTLIRTTLISQALAALLLFVLWLQGYRNPLEGGHIEAIGQVLSSVDIACGLIVYYQSGSKKKISFVLFILPVIAAPMFFFIGGRIQTALFYMVISIGIQVLAVYRYWKSTRGS